MNRGEYKTRLIGQQFGLLKVLDFHGYNNHKQIVYKCECQCENKTIVYVTYTDLKTDRNKDNCGCQTKIKQKLKKKKYNEYNLTGEYGVGYTSNTNKEFLFDLEDYELIKDYCWSEHDGYVCARAIDGSKKSTIRQHRLIMGVEDISIKVDHILHNEFDNRKSQLRCCSNQQNCFNHVPHSNNYSTGHNGITKIVRKRGTVKYRARIFINKKGIHLGYFDNLEDAIEARNKADIEHFGEYKLDESIKEEYFAR